MSAPLRTPPSSSSSSSSARYEDEDDQFIRAADEAISQQLVQSVEDTLQVRYRPGTQAGTVFPTWRSPM
jgi:hypothetical protein